MSIGTAGAFISMVAVFFGTVWRLKAEQSDLRQEVETRLTKVETEISWVVHQTRGRQEEFQRAYMQEHEKGGDHE